MANNEFFIEH